jgi:hypothetical protein
MNLEETIRTEILATCSEAYMNLVRISIFELTCYEMGMVIYCGETFNTHVCKCEISVS